MLFGSFTMLAALTLAAQSQPGAEERRRQHREAVAKQRDAEAAKSQARADERAANRRFAERYMLRESRR